VVEVGQAEDDRREEYRPQHRSPGHEHQGHRRGAEEHLFCERTL
jgi:hypothetical protein